MEDEIGRAIEWSINDIGLETYFSILCKIYFQRLGIILETGRSHGK